MSFFGPTDIAGKQNFFDTQPPCHVTERQVPMLICAQTVAVLCDLPYPRESQRIISQRQGNTRVDIFIEDGAEVDAVEYKFQFFSVVPLLPCCPKCIWSSCLFFNSGCCTLMFLYFCLCLRKLT